MKKGATMTEGKGRTMELKQYHFRLGYDARGGND